MEVTITITIGYGNSTITIKDITDIISQLIYEQLSEATIQNLVSKSEIISDDEIKITWTMELIAQTDEYAELIEDIIESDGFKDELIHDIEAFNENYKAVLVSDEDDDTTKISWLDPMTYGILNWIIVGAALCILCIFCLFICRCCYLCCSKTRRMRRAKSGYQGILNIFKNTLEIF